MKNPDLAQTLRDIAKRGPKAFYEGAVAQAIVDKVNHAPVNPARHDARRSRALQARERAPVCGTYRRYKLCSMGPPSSGGIAVLQILGMLERFPSKELATDTLEGVHLFTRRAGSPSPTAPNIWAIRIS